MARRLRGRAAAAVGRARRVAARGRGRRRDGRSGRQGDVSNPDVAFTETQPATPHGAVKQPPKPPGHPADDGFAGRCSARLPAHPLPPFPAVAPAVPLRLAGDAAERCSSSRRCCAAVGVPAQEHGRSTRSGAGRARCVAPAPRQAGRRLARVRRRQRLRRPAARAGSRPAGSSRWPPTPAVRWSRTLPARAESSPLLDHGRLYFGTEDGTLYALHAADGAIVWTYKAGGAVKGAPALTTAGCSSAPTAARSRRCARANGKQLWKTGTGGGAFGLTAGNFYATPAVAYGRVYIGNTDGFVYSFARRRRQARLAPQDRRLRLLLARGLAGPTAARSTSAPTRQVLCLRRAHGQRALDAQERRQDLGRRRPSSATWCSTPTSAATRRARSARPPARRCGRSAAARSTPSISDGKRIYIVGYATLYAFGEEGRTAEGTLTGEARTKRRNHLAAVAERRHAALRRPPGRAAQARGGPPARAPSPPHRDLLQVGRQDQVPDPEATSLLRAR